MAKEIRNVGASVRARLLQLAKASGQSFDLVLTRFALERLLFRLSHSPHGGRFVLKGAMLMMSWFDDPHRGTRDLDLLGFGSPEPVPMLETFREILAQEVDDGVMFDADTLRVDRIREELEHGGLGYGRWLQLAAPAAEMLNYPSMLGFPAPRLRAYARETVIAEKFQAMDMLGRVNSRMKDFYDIWILSRSFDFDDDRLARAIAATFERRETPIPEDLPHALTDAFAKDEQKQRQWRAFVEGVAHNPEELTNVIAEIAAFLIPHAIAAAKLGK